VETSYCTRAIERANLRPINCQRSRTFFSSKVDRFTTVTAEWLSAHSVHIVKNISLVETRYFFDIYPFVNVALKLRSRCIPYFDTRLYLVINRARLDYTPGILWPRSVHTLGCELVTGLGHFIPPMPYYTLYNKYYIYTQGMNCPAKVYPRCKITTGHTLPVSICFS